jgi:sortase A
VWLASGLWTAAEAAVTLGVVVLLLVVHQLWWTNRQAGQGAERQVRALEQRWAQEREPSERRRVREPSEAAPEPGPDPGPARKPERSDAQGWRPAGYDVSPSSLHAARTSGTQIWSTV